MDCHWVLALASSKVMSAHLLYVHTLIPGYFLSILGKSTPHTFSLTLKGQYLYFFGLLPSRPAPFYPGMEICHPQLCPVNKTHSFEQIQRMPGSFLSTNLLNLHQKN